MGVCIHVRVCIAVGRKRSAELLPSECAVRIVSVMYCCCTEQERTGCSFTPMWREVTSLLLVTDTVQMEKEKGKNRGKLQLFFLV